MSYAKRDPFVPSPDTVIWRYMDDWKFEKLLQNFSEHEQWNPEKPETRIRHFNEPGQLWFAHPGSFGDEKEGRFPCPNEDPSMYCDRLAAHSGLPEDEARRRKERFLAADTASLRNAAFFMAQMCGVSCWHASPSESAAMWRNFVAERNGVAVRAICQQVEQALALAHNTPARRASPTVGAVGYVDHSEYFLTYDGWRGLLSIIQESYSYENEVRFVAKSAALAAIPHHFPVSVPLHPTSFLAASDEWSQKKADHIRDIAEQAREAYALQRSTGVEGFHLPVSLPSMFCQVVLKPGCDADYQNKVNQLLQQAGCQHVAVSHSSLIGT